MERRTGVRIGIIAGGVVLAGAGGWWALARSEAKPPPAYETAPATRGPVSSVVTASGTLSPLVTVQVGTQVSGRVQSLYADFNSKVKKGQILARIDPTLFESQVSQARANEAVAIAAVRGAEATLAEARRQHERNVGLVAKSLVAQAEADTSLAKVQTAEADLASAKAKVAQARAARAQAETNLAYTVIPSPIDGVVISRDATVGQTVAASLQAPTIFTLAEDLRKMEVHTDVAESDVGRLTDGMKVEFTVDAFPTEKFGGTVKEVRYSPKTVQNVVTYDAVVSVDNSALKLRPGMTADVSFVVDALDDALLVPNAALRFRPPDAAVPGAAPDAATARPSTGSGRTDGDVQARGAAAAVRPERSGAEGAAESKGADSKGDPSAAAPARGDGHRRGRVVWVLGDGGALRAVPVRVGPSDGKRTAIVGGDLREGDPVVVGLAGAAAGAGNAAGGGQQQRRPGFRPPFP